MGPRRSVRRKQAPPVEHAEKTSLTVHKVGSAFRSSCYSRTAPPAIGSAATLGSDSCGTNHLGGTAGANSGASTDSRLGSQVRASVVLHSMTAVVDCFMGRCQFRRRPTMNESAEVVRAEISEGEIPARTSAV